MQSKLMAHLRLCLSAALSLEAPWPRRHSIARTSRALAPRSHRAARMMATSAARARSAARSAWWPSMPAVRCASGNGMISVLSCIHGGTASRSRQKWVCGGVSCAACGSGSRGIEPSSGGEGTRSEHGSEHSEDDVRPQSLVAARGSCLCPPAP